MNEDSKVPKQPYPPFKTAAEADRQRFEPISANARQVGGEHYRKYGHLQPWDVIAHFKLDYFTGNAVKYLLRWRDKGGIEDIRKAMHYIEKLVENIDKQRKELEASVGKDRG